MSDTKRKRYSAGPRMRSENGENYHRGSTGSSRGGRSNNSQSSGHHYHRMNSFDRVRKIVQEEGRTARNLVIYNVPIEEKPERQQRGNGHHEGRSRYSRKPPLKDQNIQPPYKSKSTSDDSLVLQKSLQDLTKSPKSDSGSRKPDLRARYWKFLFDNLQRAVDAIYETCEQDESEVECKEVIMMLEQSTRDFRSLIERLHMLKAFEESAKDGDRPTSIAWEVRKMSPGKSTSQHGQRSGSSPSPAQRVLNFTDSRSEQNTGNSWADKVRGNTLTDNTLPEAEESPPTCSLPSPPLPVTSQNGLSASEAETDGSTTIEDDNEGWETVHRGGKSKNKSSPSQRSLENLSGVGKALSGRNLKRTFSDPHAGAIRKSRYNSDSKSRLAQKSVSVGNHVNHISRQRTDSKDSEKENRPNRQSKPPEIPQSVPQSVPENTKGRMLYSACAGKGNNGSTRKGTMNKDTEIYSGDSGRQDLGSTSKPSAQELTAGDNSAFDGTVLKLDEEEIKVEVLQGDDMIEEDEEEKITISQKDKKEEEDVDILTAQLDSELATVMDEEDDLTQQLEQEQEKALENAIMEEESWLKALAQEQNTVIDVETETETESELGNTTNSLEISQPILDWDTMCAQYDAAEQDGSLKSWGEMVEEADTEARTPGHGVHMHEKLSSPSRKRSPTESKKRHEEKQAKARELREKLMTEKAERLKDLSKKVEEVRSWKEELMRQRKGTIQIKMQRAEEKRQFQLKMKAQKAHEEEAKANEIAFINTLEAQNKRHDIMSKHQESEARLHDMQEERLRKHEEKLAKEAAVEERRKALQAERQARLKEMEEKRKKRDARVEMLQQEKEKERLEAVRNKEREREERLAALNAQQQAHIQELQKKIQQKQDESTQRHQEALQQIREKAFEMSVLRHSTEDHNEAPKITPYDNKKLCTICNVLIPSEVHLLSHLRGKKHQQALQDNNSGKTMTKQEIETFNLKHIVDAPVNSTHPKIVSEKERLKSLKKRCKKLRQRMTTRGLEYENSLSAKPQLSESEHKAKLQKVIRDINKYLQTQDSGPWPQNKVSALDRGVGEIGRIMDKKVMADQNSLRVLGGLTSLSRILLVVDVVSPPSDLPPIIPCKSLILTCTVFRQACKGCYDNCHYMMFSNKIGTAIDLLIYRLSMLLPEEGKRPMSGTSNSSGSSTTEKLPYDALAVSLMQLLSSILNCLAKYRPTAKSSEASVERMSSTGDPYTVRGNDVISYIISVGIVDKLTQYFRSVQGPIDDDKDAAEFLQHSLGLLVSMTKFMSRRNSSTFEKKKAEDPTQLINTYEMTELVGIVSLLYGMLLHSGAPSRSDTPPPEFPPHTLAVALTGIKMLNNMATLNLDMLQKTLGDEGVSLEFRHIASYLMWYCSHHSSDDVLHEVIQSVGYFTVLSPDNQVVIQSGQPPTILQQLCSLPFQYFSDPKLTNVLFPTLISCCYNNQSNREILEQELSCVLLANFVEEKQLEAQQAKLRPSKKEKEKPKETDQRMLFTARFPQEHCLAAQEYFKVT